MKFATKIVMGTTLIIAVLFSVAGVLTISQNYRVAYDSAVAAAEDTFRMKQYSLESNVRNAMENGNTYSNELVVTFAGKMEQYQTSENQIALLDENYEVLYASMDEVTDTMLELVRESTDSYELIQGDHTTCVLFGTKISWGMHQVYLVSQSDITEVYRERERQLERFYLVEGGILLLSIFLVYILAAFLTRDIKKLSVYSRQIARGDYGKRTHISSRDEIGELGANFDTMAESLEAHIGELEQQIWIRQEFVADFSHELKTPMTAMMGYSRMLMASEPRNPDSKDQNTAEHLDQETRQKAATYIYKECKRLENLSRKLLMLLGLSEEKLVLRSVEAGWLVDTTTAQWSQGLQSAVGIQLQLKVENAYLEGDAALLQDLLKNLLDNATHAIQAYRAELSAQDNTLDSGTGQDQKNYKDHKKSAATGQILVSGEVLPSGRYQFRICDNGIGMRPQELAKATDTFYMADKSRSRQSGGSGLGLSICQKICTIHGTSLKLESTYGEGCQVTFELSVSTADSGGVE